MEVSQSKVTLGADRRLSKTCSCSEPSATIVLRPVADVRAALRTTYGLEHGDFKGGR